MTKRKYQTKKIKREIQMKKEMKIEKKMENKLKKKFMPKKALSAYLLYCNQRRPKVKEEHPGIVPREMISIMSKEWNSMTEEQKAPYLKMQEEDKLRFIRETMEYNNKVKGMKAKKIKIEYESKYTQIEEGDLKDSPSNATKKESTIAEDVEMKDANTEIKENKEESKETINEAIKQEEVITPMKDEEKKEETKEDVKMEEPKKENVEEIKVTKIIEKSNETQVQVSESKENNEDSSNPTSVENPI